MSVKGCERNQLNFVPERLNLPLLFVSRNRIRNVELRTLPTYISRNRNLYTATCNSENRKRTRSKERDGKLIGEYPAAARPCLNNLMSQTKRDITQIKSFHLPPNIYNATHEPYVSRRGIGGAYWKKMPEEAKRDLMPWLESGPLKKTKKVKWKLYTFPQLVERLNSPCNKHKGIFLTNARHRRATARCMITDPALVYRQPSEPSPAEYNIESHTIKYNMVPPEDIKTPNPHLFLPQSCVPQKLSSLIPRHISFQPAVGRYEVRFPKHCPCGRKIFTPGLPLLVDREKRNRFRRTRYKKINIHLHCEPDFTHVTGHGHTYLFRLPGSKLHRPKPIDKIKEGGRLEKTLQMFHDYKYINMITAPRRKSISEMVFDDVSLLPKVRFHCMFKVTMRKQIHNERKIVFGGGTARFPEDDYHPTVLTVTQLEQLKNSLPPERQFRNHSITRTPLNDIKSRLFEIPAHMKAAYEPTLRKRLFKFPAPPTPKLLVTKKYLLPQLAPGEVYTKPCVYNKRIDINEYLKQMPEMTQSLNNEKSDQQIAQLDKNIENKEVSPPVHI